MLISGIKISPLVDCIKLTIQKKNFSVFSNILKVFGENKVNIWFAVQVQNSESLMNATLCFDPSEIKKATAIISDIYPDIELCTSSSLNIVSVFPYRNNPEIAFLFLKALEGNSIPVLAVSASLSSISGLIHHKQSVTAKNFLEKTFGLAASKGLS